MRLLGTEWDVFNPPVSFADASKVAAATHFGYKGVALKSLI